MDAQICHICREEISNPRTTSSGRYLPQDPFSGIIQAMRLGHQFDEQCQVGQEFNEVSLHRKCFDTWLHKDRLINEWIGTRKRILQRAPRPYQLQKESEGLPIYALYGSPATDVYKRVCFENYKHLKSIEVPKEHWQILIETLNEIEPDEIRRNSWENPLRSEGDCFNLYSKGSYIVMLHNDGGISISYEGLTQSMIFPHDEWPSAYEFILSTSHSFCEDLLDGPWTPLEIAAVGTRMRGSPEETSLIGTLLYHEPALTKTELARDLFLEVIRMAAVSLTVSRANRYDGVKRIKLMRLLREQIDLRLEAMKEVAIADGKSQEETDSFCSDIQGMWNNYAMQIIEASFVFNVKGKKLEVAKTLLKLAAENPNRSKEHPEVVLREIQSLWERYLLAGSEVREKNSGSSQLNKGIPP